MQILSFNKITKPIYEAGLSIDCKPRGEWLVQVRRTDGTFRYPFGDRYIKNVFLNGYADGHWGGGLGDNLSGFGWSRGFANSLGLDSIFWSFLNLFYGDKSSIAVGSGTTPATQTDTGLETPIRFDSVPYPAGNAISWNSSNGNLLFTIKEQFPAETGSVTYNEAGIRITGGTSSAAMNGLTTLGSNRLINRIVFPSPITLSAGESLIIMVAVTIPTLASSAGKTITISAQNGMNVSGVLKAIGTQASMAGGTVTADGVINRTTSPNPTHVVLFTPTRAPVALLGTQTSFSTSGVDPTWGTTNQVTGVWGTYTNGNRYSDCAFQWGSGTPSTDTTFQSILFRQITNTGAYGGYQLLLDNQMTKASTGTLAIGLRFEL